MSSGFGPGLDLHLGPLCQKLEGEKTGRKIAHGKLKRCRSRAFFQGISVDMIGPLPLSKSGNQLYLGGNRIICSLSISQGLQIDRS
jgi:hypothetical protein